MNIHEGKGLLNYKIVFLISQSQHTGQQVFSPRPGSQLFDIPDGIPERMVLN